MPARTLRLFPGRHGQSEANLDKSVNARLPDHKIDLSPEGRRQAAAVGDYLAGALPSRSTCGSCAVPMPGRARRAR